jgi:ribosomal protein L37AE/L43A
VVAPQPRRGTSTSPRRVVATAQASRVPIHCSFCAKPEADVQKIIAGPGIYICDECVAACNGILETDRAPGARSAPAEIPYWDQLSDEQLLAHLPKIAAVAGQIESSLTARVRTLRDRGVTWSRIGIALDMTRQSAWERFSGED